MPLALRLKRCVRALVAEQANPSDASSFRAFKYATLSSQTSVTFSRARSNESCAYIESTLMPEFQLLAFVLQRSHLCTER